MVRKHIEDFDYSVLWLANTSRLLNLLKQYSGEPVEQSNE